MTEGEEEGESMHVHEDYRNHPYHPPTLTLVCIDSFIAGFLSLCLRNSQFNFAERAEVELTLNWPICVGFAILDLSKMLMHDFHYNYSKRNYPDSTLLFTDQIPSRIKFKRISIYSIFLGTKKKAHSTMMKTKK